MAIRTAWPVPRCGSCTTVVTGQPAVTRWACDVVATHGRSPRSCAQHRAGRLRQVRGRGAIARRNRAEPSGELTSSGCPHRRPGPRPQTAGEESPRTKPPECRRTDRSRSVLPGCTIGLVNRPTEPIPTACSTQLPGHEGRKVAAVSLGDSDSNRDCKAPKACGLPITLISEAQIGRPPRPSIGAVAGRLAPGTPPTSGWPPRLSLLSWLRRLSYGGVTKMEVCRS